jgi:hypothetical protein
MATTYDSAKDGLSGATAGASQPDNLGSNSAAVTPSDTVDFTSYPKAIVVTSIAGGATLTVLPLKAADDGAHLIAFAGVTVGFIPPFRVRRVMATGTTASVATVAD